MGQVAHLSSKNPPAVNADPQHQREGASPSLERDKLSHPLLHRQSRRRRGNTVTGAKHFSIEKRGDRIAPKLEQHALVGVNLGDERIEETADHRTHFLGPLTPQHAQAFGKRREAGEVSEEEAAFPERATDPPGVRIGQLRPHKANRQEGRASRDLRSQVGGKARPHLRREVAGTFKVSAKVRGKVGM